MKRTNEDLLKLCELTIPSLGGRSSIDFAFSSQNISITNSQGRTSIFSWSDLDAVSVFCKTKGYGKVGVTYNPMNGGNFPEGYPKHQDTLSLVALVHYMVGSHPYL
ncbi:hypothetical protein CSB62_17780 [Vibrio splendidus]|nr:hypothetical protein CSB62_17780 [Vibrio splendidus]